MIGLSRDQTERTVRDLALLSFLGGKLLDSFFPEKSVRTKTVLRRAGSRESKNPARSAPAIQYEGSFVTDALKRDERS
jgi:hypothetical protein